MHFLKLSLPSKVPPRWGLGIVSVNAAMFSRCPIHFYDVDGIPEEDGKQKYEIVTTFPGI